MYVIVRELAIDVGAIIEKAISECAMKKHKTTPLLFPSLITSICFVSGVCTIAQDECIKNEVLSLHAPSKELLVNLLQHHQN